MKSPMRWQDVSINVGETIVEAKTTVLGFADASIAVRFEDGVVPVDGSYCDVAAGGFWQ